MRGWLSDSGWKRAAAGARVLRGTRYEKSIVEARSPSSGCGCRGADRRLGTAALMILLLAAVIAVAALPVRPLAGPWRSVEPPHQVPPGRSPPDILKERYAREIDKEGRAKGGRR